MPAMLQTPQTDETLSRLSWLLGQNWLGKMSQARSLNLIQQQQEGYKELADVQLQKELERMRAESDINRQRAVERFMEEVSKDPELDQLWKMFSLYQNHPTLKDPVKANYFKSKLDSRAVELGKSVYQQVSQGAVNPDTSADILKGMGTQYGTTMIGKGHETQERKAKEPLEWYKAQTARTQAATEAAKEFGVTPKEQRERIKETIRFLAGVNGVNQIAADADSAGFDQETLTRVKTYRGMTEEVIGNRMMRLSQLVTKIDHGQGLTDADYKLIDESYNASLAQAAYQLAVKILQEPALRAKYPSFEAAYERARQEIAASLGMQ